MDPDATLMRIRDRLAAIDRGEDVELHTEFLLIEFSSLDKWITDGGYLPRDWNHSD